MALTNAEKQARWRERHAMKRHAVQRISKAILRRQWSDGAISELASALRSVLNTAGIVALRRALKPKGRCDLRVNEYPPSSLLPPALGERRLAFSRVLSPVAPPIAGSPRPCRRKPGSCHVVSPSRGRFGQRPSGVSSHDSCPPP